MGELGAQSNYTNKKGEGERSVINGAHEAADLQKLLDKFIEKYILCQNCHLPEIDMKVKGSNINAKCKACGWAGELDSAHRIASYIRNNPPDASGLNVESTDADAGGSKKKDRRARKQAKQQGEDVDDEENSDDDAEETEKKTKKKSKKKGKDSDDDDSGDEKKKKKKKKS